MKRLVLCSKLLLALALADLSPAGVLAQAGSNARARTSLPAAGALSQHRAIGRRSRVACNYPALATARQRAHNFARAYNFASVLEIKSLVERILRVAGVSRSVIGIEETEDDSINARAGVQNGRLFIYYNPTFMEQIIGDTGTEWAAIFVLAHEIGHLHWGHPFEDDGSNPQEEQEIRHRQEIEADRYAGFILRKMKAPLDKAQAAVEVYTDARGSHTHPPKVHRLDAVREGWQEADINIKDLAAAEGPQAAPRPAPRATPQPEPRVTRPAAPQAGARPAQSALPISVRNTARPIAQDRWSWTVYLDAPPEVLNQIRCVRYQLHSTFSPPVVEVCELRTGQPFALTAEGWGTFRIQIQVLTKDNLRYDLYHDLRFR